MKVLLRSGPHVRGRPHALSSFLPGLGAFSKTQWNNALITKQYSDVAHQMKRQNLGCKNIQANTTQTPTRRVSKNLNPYTQSTHSLHVWLEHRGLDAAHTIDRQSTGFRWTWDFCICAVYHLHLLLTTNIYTDIDWFPNKSHKCSLYCYTTILKQTRRLQRCPLFILRMQFSSRGLKNSCF